jgi:REP element-mobilizing transposase RayT
MARTARAELEGSIYHITQRGNRRQAIFESDYERRFFLEELEVTAERYGWRWLIYCLMTNHYHLVVEIDAPTLGDGMRRFGSVHAQMFNRRRSTNGHVFQERYGSVLVRTDAQFVQLLRYVALNPVAAGLCADPMDWPWSSHHLMLGGSDEAAAARARVEELLEAWGGVSGTRYAKVFATDDGSAAPLAEPTASLHRPPLNVLASLQPREHAMRVALAYGYNQREVAGALGMSQSTVSRSRRRADEPASWSTVPHDAFANGCIMKHRPP